MVQEACAPPAQYGIVLAGAAEMRSGKRVIVGPAIVLNSRCPLLMIVIVIKLKKSCQRQFFLCSLKNVFFPFRCLIYELEKMLIKEISLDLVLSKYCILSV